MNEIEYYKLHKLNLTPLKFKIDVDLFEKQIEKYEFRAWGDKLKKFYLLILVKYKYLNKTHV